MARGFIHMHHRFKILSHVNRCPYLCPVVDKPHSIVRRIDTSMTSIVDVARSSESRTPAISRVTCIMDTIRTIEAEPVVHP